MSFMVSPYQFAASGPTTDVIVAVQDFDTGTTTGSPISYTSPLLTGLTAKAALFIGSKHDIASGSAEVVDAIFGFGFAAGTDQRAVSFESRDNQTSSSVADAGSTAFAYLLRHPSGVSLFGAGDPAFASGGIDITYTNTNADRRANFMAFAGADVTAAIGTISLGTGTSAISVSPGFEPDVVILIGQNRTTISNQNSFQITYGVALNDGTQRCVAMAELTGDAAGNKPYQAILTDCAGAHVTTGGALSYKLTVGGFSGTGFEVTPSASASSNVISYLALKLTGRQVALKDYTTPTSTGSRSISDVGFEPQAVLAFITNLSATDPTFPLTTGDDQGGLAICSIGNEAWSHAIRINSGSDPTDTASFSGNYAIIAPSATDCKAGLATLTSLDSGGWTENWSAAQGSAKVGFYLAIE